VAGYDVLEQPIEAKRHTGYLPETPPLYPDMRVRDYLTFVAKIKGVPRNQVRTRVDSTMEKARVTEMARRECGRLSKGYRQRVGLAQALLHDPDVLILDEPTAGLDPKQIIETRQLIKELAGTHTIILSTHILPEVSQTCQRVVIINRGRVVAVDTPDNLISKLRGSEAMYLQVDGLGADVASAIRQVPGVTDVHAADALGGLEVASETGRDVRRDLAAAVVSRGWGLLELRPLRVGLEEVFLQLTTDDTAASGAGEETHA
jgi:ABC-2 type transport system ATP-binding protein